MADHHLSLRLDPEPLAAASAAGSGSAPARLTLEFLDAAGEPTGRTMRPVVPAPIAVEVPSGTAGFEHQAVAPHVSLAAAGIADEAVTVRARAAGVVLVELPLSAAAARAPHAPAARRVFNPTGKWKLLLVSEEFPDAPTFFAACAALDAFIRSQPPFADPALSARFQIEALFWPSPPGGLFNTVSDGRRILGDNKLVNKFVKAANAKGNVTIVLVDRPVRGGAGGSKDRPAWVSITSAPNERWEMSAMHELGHSFGLADEYDDSSQPTPEPHPLEPNITDKRNAAKAPWAALCTPGIASNPTCAAGIVPPVPLGVVGTFEGARYRPTGRYRPTAECLMQRTDRPFCPVCQAQVRKALASA
ncbi:MAG TPA: M64 family metallopeptidase [Allosphingosinicella sp.]|jgi:hypothetical protein